MLLIPAEKGFGSENLPWLTFSLIVLNIVAFFSMQSGDMEVHYEAMSFYSDNDIIELEKDVFLDYAETERPELFAEIVQEEYSDLMIAEIILYDKHFSHFITSLDSYSYEWAGKRDQLNDIINESSILKYAFYPSEPDILTAFSHMFMHAGIDHLFGNLLFLFVFGYNVELLIGRGKMLATYLFSGLAAVGLFALTAKDMFVPLVGASGAISGLMGGYAGYYGLQKVRYVYWIFVLFNYIRLPAALVLGYWLLSEWISSITTDNQVAYMAHFGGLVAGAMMVAGIRYLPRLFGRNAVSEVVSVDSMSSSDWQGISPREKMAPSPSANPATESALLTRGSDAMGALDLDIARDCFAQLVELRPANREYLASLYNLEKNDTESDGYRKLAAHILEQSAKNSAIEDLADLAVTNLNHTEKRFAGIDSALLFGYAKRRVNHDNLTAARPLVKHLANNERDHQQLPGLMLSYALACGEAGDWQTRHKTLSFIASQWPQSFAGEEAKAELAKD